MQPVMINRVTYRTNKSPAAVQIQDNKPRPAKPFAGPAQTQKVPHPLAGTLLPPI